MNLFFLPSTRHWPVFELTMSFNLPPILAWQMLVSFGLVWGPKCFSSKGLSYSGKHRGEFPQTACTPSHPDMPFNSIFKLSIGNLVFPYFSKGKGRQCVCVYLGRGRGVGDTSLDCPLSPSVLLFCLLHIRHTLWLCFCHIGESSDKHC